MSEVDGNVKEVSKRRGQADTREDAALLGALLAGCVGGVSQLPQELQDLINRVRAGSVRSKLWRKQYDLWLRTNVSISIEAAQPQEAAA